MTDLDESLTRQQRRHAERQARKQPGKKYADRADLIRLFAAMAEADETLSGVTIIMPGSKPEYLDGDLFRRGGGRA